MQGPLASGQLSRSVDASAFPPRPANSRAAARSGRGWEEQSRPQPRAAPTSAQNGEHRTFPEASTVARSAQAGEAGGSGSHRQGSAAAARSAATTWRDGRPFVDWPGASKLFGGRCRAR